MDAGKKFRFSACPCCGGTVSLRWPDQRVRPPRTSREFFYGGRDFLPEIPGCPDCGFHFLNETCQDEDRFYRESDTSDYLKLSQQRRWYFLAVRKLVLSFLGGIDTPCRMLDMGCASGEWLDCWPEAQERWGVEVNPEFASASSSLGVKVAGGLEGVPDAFDLVTAFDFLEHTQDPAAALDLLREKLAPGGTLVLGVPDMGKRICALLGRRYYLYCPMHYSYFTREALSRLIVRVLGSSEVSILSSPAMHTTLEGILKWLSGGSLKGIGSAVRLPVGYSASLIAIARVKAGAGEGQ